MNQILHEYDGIIRVFPRKTNACPDDGFVRYGPPECEGDGVVHVSCTFTYDREKAERLADDWQAAGYDVSIGGPAFNSPAEEFIPGMYLKKGMVITSRGCNNRCWFCYVPKREGRIRELHIKEGWIVADNNLLACSKKHVLSVFAMLKRQKKRARFTGGLEAGLLRDWHVNLLDWIKFERLYLAYDTPDDYEPLVVAAQKLRKAGFRYDKLSCYVLIGYPKDTLSDAEKRLNAVVKLGLMPFAMLWRNDEGEVLKQWRQFQRHWAAPVVVGAKMKAAGW